MIAPVVPSFSPAASASCALGTLCRQTITASHSICPSEVATARTRSSPRKASTFVPKRSVTPRLVSDSCTGSATSGSSSSDSAHGPSSMKSTSRPRCARLPAISTPIGVPPIDDDALHRVEFLVELHRGADVLDVVQPVEVGAGHVGLLPRPTRADRELVEALVRVARGHRAAVEVDVGDRRLHPHVEPVLDIAVDGREEQRLELVDLAPVHERDPARRVGDVGELREERDLEVRVQPLGDRRGGRARAATADHDQTLAHSANPSGGPCSPRSIPRQPVARVAHGSSVRYSISGGDAKVFETQHSRRALAMYGSSGTSARAETSSRP